MPDWFDIALIFGGIARGTDVALGDDGDLLVDETPATAMILSLGLDRRAADDDELPTGISEINAPSSFVERRGWAGDALDLAGRLAGSRLWLIDRAKETEGTRLAAAAYAREAFDWVAAETGRPATIDVAFVQRGRLQITASVDGRAVTLQRAL